MDERFKQVGQFVGGTLQESARQVGSEIELKLELEGFSQAAAAALQVVEARLEELKSRMSGNGPRLSEEEQVLFATLDRLHEEMEARFDRYWRGVGVDWRRPKPLVRGVRLADRPDDEQQS